jgi:hypothetical protein
LSGCHKSVFTQFTLTRTFLFTDKIISYELQNISGNTVTKIKSVVIFINITINITLFLLLLLLIIIIIIAIATRRPRLHSHQSDASQYTKTLDSTELYSACPIWEFVAGTDLCV